MSVRNQYARNYSKIAPMPLSSNQLVNARNAARRRNLYRAPDEAEDVISHGEKCKYGDAEKIAELKSGCEITEPFQFRKIDRLKKANDVTIYGKHELNKVVTKNSTNKMRDLSQNKYQIMKAKDNEIKTKTSHQSSIKSGSNVNQSARPKSARPDSRWERRVSDDITFSSDEEEENNTSIVRPISARPESRIARSVETENISDFPTERPKTSHGRRKSSDSNRDETINKKERHKEQKERPKSRIGHFKEMARDVDECIDKKQYFTKKSNNRQLQTTYTENDAVFNDTDYNIGISTFYPDLMDKIHETSDINLQIDDIDRDVDPVLFFMQDNDNRGETNSTRKTSLSKDAISVITNEKNSRPSKSVIGFQGNNQIKRNSAPEVIDRFHRNRVLSLQSSIADDSQRHFNHRRHERIKSDSLIGISEAGENINKSRTNTKNVETIPSPGVLTKRETDIGKQSSNYDNMAYRQHKYNISTTRKPRKLKPLAPSCLEE